MRASRTVLRETGGAIPPVYSPTRRRLQERKREWRPKGSPEAVRVHHFIIPELGRTVPYGVYDIAGGAGWGSVGVDHDTAAFAVKAIQKSTHLEVCVESIGLSRAASIRGGIVENE